MIDLEKIRSRALQVIETERSAIDKLSQRIDDHFVAACELLLHCKGRVILTGMGKSGHIANKIAATFASTGTPAFFVHPGEANHGDMGMIVPQDLVLALSNSGTTPELLTLLPFFKRFSVPLITMTGNPQSLLAKAAKINLDVSVEKEACPLDLAPTASTTTALVMGDALAMALLDARGFTREDFALAHPGGALGRRLLLRVEDLMHKGAEIPMVKMDTTLKDALIEMSRKKLGMTTIVNDTQHLQGIYTDGDLRRTLDKNIDIHTAKIQDVMSTQAIAIESDTLAVDALNLMEERRITNLAVIDKNRKVEGVLHMHDLLRAGVV
jgi:arabinose-5-phosphate isomerase